MRIKIEGRVTRERLLAAFEKATELLGPDFEGFYNVNLYLQAHDRNGARIENSMIEGETADLLMCAPEGELLRPAVVKKESPVDQKPIAKIPTQWAGMRKVNEADRIRQAKLDAEAMNRNAALIEQGRRDAEFRMIVETIGANEVQRQMNTLIERIWATTTPLYTDKRMRGLPRPVPSFELGEAGYFIRLDMTGKKFRKIGSPVSMVQEYPDVEGNFLKPLWAYPEWKFKVVPGIEAVLDSFKQRIVLTVQEEDAETSTPTM